MKEERSQNIELYLGRHSTKASGLWVYGKAVLRALLIILQDRRKRGLGSPLIRVTYGGDDSFQRELEAIRAGFERDIELCPLSPVLGGRRAGMVSDIFRRSETCLVHGTSNLVPLRGGSLRILTIHDILQAYSPAPAGSSYVRLRRAFYKLLLRGQCRLADLVITDHQSNRLDLERHLKCSTPIRIVFPPLDAVYLGTDLPDNRSTPDRSLLAFASGDPRKNLGALLAAFAAWKNRGAWRLKIVSNTGSAAAHLEALASSLGIGPNIEMMSGIDQREMPALYSSAAGLLFPSLGEGFGYPVYEALSQGVPVLCASGMIIEPLSDAVKGGVVETDCSTPGSLLKGLCRLASLHWPLEERQAAARAVRELLRDEVMARELEKIYAEKAPEIFGPVSEGGE